MSRIASIKDSLFELQKVCLSQNIAFVTFCLPNQKDIYTFIQHKSHPQKIDSLSQINTQQGFILAPFYENPKFPIFLLEPDCIIQGLEVDKEKINELRAAARSNDEFISSDIVYESSKDEFLHQVEAIKKEIQTGSLDKAVLSRVHLVSRNDDLEVPEIFNELCTNYPRAFKYILNIPGAGNWIGATPEPLLEVHDNVIETVSLAGTQKLNGVPIEKVKWQTKELDEQKFVTAFIESHLSDFGITGYLKNGPFSQQAANLVHLKSTFSFDRNSLKEKFGEFLSALHPTPSVCGLPKNEAYNFIKQLEKHEREYYTGFLGPLNIVGSSSLFVNLRCMRVLPNQFALFVGAGITSGSTPENEWEETELKMQTLLSVLNKLNTKNG